MALSGKITTCFLFSGNAREAAQYYVSIFKGSRIISDGPVVIISADGSLATWAMSAASSSMHG